MSNACVKLTPDLLPTVVASCARSSCDEFIHNKQGGKLWNNLTLQLARYKAVAHNYRRQNSKYELTDRNNVSPIGNIVSSCLQTIGELDASSHALLDAKLPRPLITVAERSFANKESAIFLLWGVPGLSAAQLLKLKHFELFCRVTKTKEAIANTNFYRIASVCRVDDGNMGATLSPLQNDCFYHICLRAVFTSDFYSKMSNTVIV